jgi:hypothetical protein
MPLSDFSALKGVWDENEYPAQFLSPTDFLDSPVQQD